MISHFPKNLMITTICGRTEDEDERVEEAEEAEEVYFILYSLSLLFFCIFHVFVLHFGCFFLCDILMLPH